MWFTLLVIACILPLLAQTQSLLWIPGTDEQPISADMLGVGTDGRTTWQLQQGTPTGTFVDADGFPGTATLVEGPSDAVLSAVFNLDGSPVSAVESCMISGSLAGCVLAMGAQTATQTETVSAFAVQVGGSPSEPNSSGAAPTAAPSIHTPGGGAALAGSSPTISGAQATGLNGASNAAPGHQTAHSLFALGIAGSVVYSIL